MAIIVVFHVVMFLIGAMISFYGVLCGTSFRVGLVLGLAGFAIVMLDIWSFASLIMSLKR